MAADEMLSQFTIPNPCPEDWDRMSGDERVRYCAGCGKHVHNLAVMSPDETASVLSTVPEQSEATCVRLYLSHDGTLFGSECPPAPRGEVRRWQFTIRSLMVIVVGCATVLGLTNWLLPEQEQPPAPAALGPTNSLSPEQRQRKPPSAANSQIIMGKMVPRTNRTKI
jgi:hypothetical protein